MRKYYYPKSVKFHNPKAPSERGNYTTDYDNPITEIYDTSDKLVYLSEVSKENLTIHHVTDGKHSEYLKLRDKTPDICVTYSTKKDMLVILDLI